MAHLKDSSTTFSSLLAISLPLMAGNLIETIYNLTDTFFLGKLGSAEVSAPSIAFPLIMFVIVMGMGIAMAGTTLIAQSKGKGDQQRIDYYLGQTTSLLMSLALILGVGGFLMTPGLLRLLQTPAEVLPLSRDYMEIIFMGLPLMFGFFVIRAAMQGTGNTLVPLLIQLATVAVNIPLDALLIFGAGPIPPLSVKGAALATVTSRGLGSLAALVVLLRGNQGMKLRLSCLRPRRHALGLFLKIGVPAALGQGLSSLGFAVLQGVVNLFGTSVIAAFGVGNRLISVFNMPAMGLARGTTSLVGQNLGAGRREEALKTVRTAAAMIFAFLIPCMILAFFFGGSLVRFFVDDPEAIRWGALFFRIVTPSVVLFGGFLILTGAFQGAGDSRPVMWMNVGRLWGIRVPLAYLLALGLSLGPLGIWYAMFVSNLVITLLGYAYYRKEKWMEALKPGEV